jgi:hypothetical protein
MPLRFGQFLVCLPFVSSLCQQQVRAQGSLCDGEMKEPRLVHPQPRLDQCDRHGGKNRSDAPS